MQVTFLSSMAGAELAVAAQRHRELGISILDIKDGVFGNRVEDLTPELAKRARSVIDAAQCSVYCLSSSIGFSDLVEGKDAFAERHVPAMRRLLQTANILQPAVIRLLAPRTSLSLHYRQAVEQFPWIIGAYQQLVDLASAAGFPVLIENEVDQCILTTPTDIQSFIDHIDASGRRPRRVKVIYDVQNLWQMGWFPTVETVRQLAPILGGLHLKGGQTNGGTSMMSASPLETASWPVLEITRAAIDTGTVPVICLNPSHGQRPAGYDVWETGKKDLAFLRGHFPEIQQHALST